MTSVCFSGFETCPQRDRIIGNLELTSQYHTTSQEKDSNKFSGFLQLHQIATLPFFEDGCKVTPQDRTIWLWVEVSARFSHKSWSSCLESSCLRYSILIHNIIYIYYYIYIYIHSRYTNNKCKLYTVVYLLILTVNIYVNITYIPAWAAWNDQLSGGSHRYTKPQLPSFP